MSNVATQAPRRPQEGEEAAGPRRRLRQGAPGGHTEEGQGEGGQAQEAEAPDGPDEAQGLDRAASKSLIVTWVPFIIVYYFMGDFVSGCKFPSICISRVVAYSPMPIPFIVDAHGYGTMVLIWWYFLSSLSFGTLLSKLLGTSRRRDGSVEAIILCGMPAVGKTTVAKADRVQAQRAPGRRRGHTQGDSPGAGLPRRPGTTGGTPTRG